MQIPQGSKVIFKGGSFVGALPSRCEFINSPTITITSNNTIQTLKITGAVSITIPSGMFLSVSTSLDLTNATGIILESTGYFSIPDGTSTSLITAGTSGSTSRVCFYGSSVVRVTATANNTTNPQLARVTVYQADSIPVLIERNFNGSWVVVGNFYASATCDISDDCKSMVFRAFNGISFIESPPTQRNYFLVNKTASFAVASDWALDRAKTIICHEAPQISGNNFLCQFL